MEGWVNVVLVIFVFFIIIFYNVFISFCFVLFVLFASSFKILRLVCLLDWNGK